MNFNRNCVSIHRIVQSRCFSSKKFNDKLQNYASRPQTSVPLKSLLEFGAEPTEKTLLQASTFLHHELPIRLAKRAKELENLPYGLCRMPSVELVRQWYVSSFNDIVSLPRPTTFSEERKFTNLIKLIYERHSGTLWTMARGVHELKYHILKETEKQGMDIHTKHFTLQHDYPEIQRFLDNFFMSRIGIRVLIGQHIALHENIDGWVGLICERTSPAEISRNAIEHASQICIYNYGKAPKVTISGHKEYSFPYVPAFLHHILFELLKNSMRAVVEYHQDSNYLPEIKVIISDGERNDDVCIKIMDEGGGILRREADNIWDYMYTTADIDTAQLFEELKPEISRDFGDELPMAGLGYGLPISRLFARYFGGEIQIISMEGYGTDAYIHMRCLGDSEEPLP